MQLIRKVHLWVLCYKTLGTMLYHFHLPVHCHHSAVGERCCCIPVKVHAPLGWSKTDLKAATGAVWMETSIFSPNQAQFFLTLDPSGCHRSVALALDYWQAYYVNSVNSWLAWPAHARHVTGHSSNKAPVKQGSERVDSDYFSQHVPSPAPSIMNQPVMTPGLCASLNR